MYGLTSGLLRISLMVLLATFAVAQNDCSSLLAPFRQGTTNITLRGVTMNQDAVVSFVRMTLVHLPPIVTVARQIPARFVTEKNPRDVVIPDTGKRAQTFSDRIMQGTLGRPANAVQRFDIGHADDVDVEITDTASPQVTFILRSWGNAKATFQAACEPGGFISGTDAGGVKYVFKLTTKAD